MIRSMPAVLVVLISAFAPQQVKNDKPASESEQPASQPAARTKARNPRQAQIYEALLRDTEQARAQPIVSRQPGADFAGADAGPSTSGRLLLEGEPLNERAGRLVRTGSCSEFHFKSGEAAGGALPAMEFNKNSLLEVMEGEAEAGVKEFIISARVTTYRGKNYLNLEKFRRQVSHGNLSP